MATQASTTGREAAWERIPPLAAERVGPTGVAAEGAAIAAVVQVIAAYAVVPSFMTARLLPWRWALVVGALSFAGVVAAALCSFLLRPLSSARRLQHAALLFAAGWILTRSISTVATRPFDATSLMLLALPVLPLASVGAPLIGVAWLGDRLGLEVKKHWLESLALPFLFLCIVMGENPLAYTKPRSLVFFTFFSLVMVALGSSDLLRRSSKLWGRSIALAGLVVVVAGTAYFNAAYYRRLFQLVHVGFWLAGIYAGSRVWAMLWRSPANAGRRALIATLAALFVAGVAEPKTRAELGETASASVLAQLVHQLQVLPGRAVLPSPPEPPLSPVAFTASPTEEQRPHVVLVAVDTLRADRVNRRLMPRTMEFIDRGTQFTRARVHWPSTREAFAGVFSGRQVYRVRQEPGATLFDWLRSAGYETAYLGINDPMKVWNVEPDHTVVVPLHPKWSLKQTRDFVSRFRDFLHAGTAPKAVLLHIAHPHAPYAPWNPPRETDERALYDACVRDADVALGLIFSVITGEADRRPSLTVLFSDHGEEFWEHGGRFHSKTIYEEQVRIAFAVVGPGVHAQRARDAVSLLDAVPTVLEAAGAKPTVELDGRSLFPRLRGASLPPRPVVVQTGLNDRPVSRAVIVEPFKLVANYASGTLELYDLAADPGEQVNVIERLPSMPEELLSPIGLGRWR